MQVVLSATLSRLLPLQLGFERFQYIAQFSLLRSMQAIQRAALINMSFSVRPQDNDMIFGSVSHLVWTWLI